MNKWVLLIGDLVMLYLFALIGELSHNKFTNPLGTLGTAAPFIIVWLVIGFLAGIYKMEHYNNFGTMFKKTALLWLIAIPAGLGIRALSTGEIPLPFFIVTMISTFILLFLWRTIYVWVNKRRNA
ncbi:DUF3054 domain-containing protein [Effusibacillus consociatus]|uniref:DUF3054 domain-containing protein n=1 Tax=Effusibacillus consociatus TaxID=1117041 RepID=A0ABV9Q049_9BACL